MTSTGEPQHIVEGRLLQIGHAEIEGYLLGIWGLPFPIVQSVAFHHEPSPARDSVPEILAAVHVAATLTDAEDSLVPPSNPAALLNRELLAASLLEGELEHWLALAEKQKAPAQLP